MEFPDEQIAELKQLCPEIKLCEEGGVTYFYLPNLQLPPGCTPAQVDALFCPTALHGYTSRLFFAQVISSPKPLNWNLTNSHILDRNWNAFSWKIDRTGLRLAQTLAIHLGAFR
jgi:hypothetical protein